MKTISKNLCYTCLTLATGLGSHASQGADWSLTTVQFLNGANNETIDFTLPGGPGAGATQDTITLEHVSSWKYGENYFFVDFYQRDNEDGSEETTVFGEYYSNFKLGKIFGKTEPIAGPLTDVAIQVGTNWGNDIQWITYGLNTYWNIPGVAYFSLAVAAIEDTKGPVHQAGGDTGFQITPVWSVPFDIGNTKWQFNGFVDYISDRGLNTEDQILTQPKLLFDLGHTLFNDTGKLFVGIEYSYWKNKFGLDLPTERNPQLMIQWNM